MEDQNAAGMCILIFIYGKRRKKTNVIIVNIWLNMYLPLSYQEIVPWFEENKKQIKWLKYFANYILPKVSIDPSLPTPTNVNKSRSSKKSLKNEWWCYECKVVKRRCWVQSEWITSGGREPKPAWDEQKGGASNGVGKSGWRSLSLSETLLL